MLVIIALVVCVVCLVPVWSEAEVTEWVQRRQGGDIYKTNGSETHQLCSTATPTYLVDRIQCVNDQQLLKGCSNAVVPVGFSQFITIATVDSYITHLVDSDNRITRFYFNETSQMLTNSLCHIISLEVYRGKGQATEIRNDGFFTSSDGSIEIHKGKLAYGLEQYGGELYRMNLSCSNIPESGCLFFKVKGKIFKNFITNAKFNCTVPGTLSEFSDECNISMTTTTSPTSPTKIINSMMSIFIVLGGVATTLAITIPGCAILIGLLVKRKKGSASAVITDHEEEGLEDLHPPQNGSCNSTDDYRLTSSDKEESTLDVAISSSKCVKNQAYIHLDPEEEGHQDPPRETCFAIVSVSASKCTKNPAYVHLAPEEESQDLQTYSTGVARVQHPQTCIVTDMSGSVAAISASPPCRCVTHDHLSSDMNSQMVHSKYSQNLANIHLNLGERSSDADQATKGNSEQQQVTATTK